MKYGHLTMLPIGAFEPMYGRMRLHGGGNPVEDIINTVENLGQGLINTVSDVGVSLDEGVRQNIPGGWATVGAAALTAVGIYDPELLTAADAGTLSSEQVAAAGYDPVAVSSQVAAVDTTGAVADQTFNDALVNAFNAPADVSGNVAAQTAGLDNIGLGSQVTQPTLGANYTGDTLGTVGNGLSDVAPAPIGLGVGAYNAGVLGPLADASTLAAPGTVLGAVTGLGGLSLADLAPAAAGAGIGSTLESLLPSSALGQAALLSGITGLGSALIGANASQNAADTQSQAAQNAANLQQQTFNTQNAQLAPNRAAGYNALNQLQGMLPGQYTQFDAQGNPIGTATGTGYLTNQMTPSDYANYMSPYYQFGLNQGLGQASNIANATGGRLGGNTLQGLNQYAQDYAQSGAQQAYNNYQGQRTNIYNTLAGIAGLGQAAQGTTADLAGRTATAQGNLGVGSAAAQAAGKIGQAGAYTGAVGNLANNFMLASLLNPSNTSNYVAPPGGYGSTLGSLNLG
jgi:hypothetical protein